MMPEKNNKTLHNSSGMMSTDKSGSLLPNSNFKPKSPYIKKSLNYAYIRQIQALTYINNTQRYLRLNTQFPLRPSKSLLCHSPCPNFSVFWFIYLGQDLGGWSLTTSLTWLGWVKEVLLIVSKETRAINIRFLLPINLWLCNVSNGHMYFQDEGREVLLCNVQPDRLSQTLFYCLHYAS